MLIPVSLGEFCRVIPVGVNEDGSRGSFARSVRVSVVRLRLNAVMLGGVWSLMKPVACTAGDIDGRTELLFAPRVTRGVAAINVSSMLVASPIWYFN